MKRYIITIIILLFLATSLSVIFLSKEKNLSTDQLKKRMENTASIYVCHYYGSPQDKICDENNLIKIITDKNDINSFITIVKRAEEEEASTFVMDSYRLYLVDSNNKILLVIDYDPHLHISLSQKTVYLYSEEFDTIAEILDIEI